MLMGKWRKAVEMIHVLAAAEKNLKNVMVSMKVEGGRCKFDGFCKNPSHLDLAPSTLTLL